MKNASTVSEDTASNQEPTLHRGLHNRHIQLIALGGAIGTGLFLGIGPAIQMAGPAVLLGYGVAGIIAFLITPARRDVGRLAGIRVICLL
ncbi:phenylalanine:H+ symporter PheP [Escherichia coli]|nr:phenylalanine:H+ symporter PheP [Escherichia coli]